MLIHREVEYDPPDMYKHHISVASNNHCVFVTQKHLRVKLLG